MSSSGPDRLITRSLSSVRFDGEISGSIAMKTTVGDVARSAVLTATVDRVLNNRVGVSATSRHRVHDAARKLGYLPTFESVSLPSKPTHLEFIAPVAKNAFLKRLGKHIEDFAGRLPLIASCTMHRLGSYSPDETLAAVEKMFFEGERAWYSCARSPEDARHVALSCGGRRTHCHSCVGHPGVPSRCLRWNRQSHGWTHSGVDDGQDDGRAIGNGRCVHGIALLSRS
jgi:hypothetical protein